MRSISIYCILRVLIWDFDLTWLEGGDREKERERYGSATGSFVKERTYKREDRKARCVVRSGESEQERGGFHVFQDRVSKSTWRWINHILSFCGRLSSTLPKFLIHGSFLCSISFLCSCFSEIESVMISWHDRCSPVVPQSRSRGMNRTIDYAWFFST